MKKIENQTGIEHPGAPSASSKESSCPKCGAVLPENAPLGLCPRCLMAEAMLPTEDQGSAERSALPDMEEVRAAFPSLEILELIGAGGMGVVYKARQTSLNRLVALKLLAPHRGAEPGFGERFTREAQALASMNHPNIVTVHDFGQAGGFFHLLMEFVDGVNLRQAMQGRHFTPEQALAIVPPICEALQYAHDRGIVHRDIKPENLLLDKEGRVKVADFGIARILSRQSAEEETPLTSGPGLTLDGALGTPAYMAPEQAEHPGQVDHRADIYSLGVVFYEMLTGEPPQGRIQPPSSRVLLDVRLDEIVLRALADSPELRWPSATAMRTQVETIAATQPPPAAPPRPELPPQRPPQPPKNPASVVIGVLLLLAALIIPTAGTTILAWFDYRGFVKESQLRAAQREVVELKRTALALDQQLEDLQKNLERAEASSDKHAASKAIAVVQEKRLRTQIRLARLEKSPVSGSPARPSAIVFWGVALVPLIVLSFSGFFLLYRGGNPIIFRGCVIAFLFIAFVPFVIAAVAGFSRGGKATAAPVSIPMTLRVSHLASDGTLSFFAMPHASLADWEPWLLSTTERSAQDSKLVTSFGARRIESVGDVALKVFDSPWTGGGLDRARASLGPDTRNEVLDPSHGVLLFQEAGPSGEVVAASVELRPRVVRDVHLSQPAWQIFPTDYRWDPEEGRLTLAWKDIDVPAGHRFILETEGDIEVGLQADADSAASPLPRLSAEASTEPPSAAVGGRATYEIPGMPGRVLRFRLANSGAGPWQQPELIDFQTLTMITEAKPATVFHLRNPATGKTYRAVLRLAP